MFVSLCGIVCSASRLSASRLGVPNGSSSASQLGVPNWRPSASRLGVPNWRPELGPFQPVPNWGVQRVPNELFIKVQVWGVGVGGGVFQRVPTWGGPKQGIPARPAWPLFPGSSSGGVRETRVVAECGDFGAGGGPFALLVNFLEMGGLPRPGTAREGGRGVQKGSVFVCFWGS